jgi:hypothetical protein
MSLFAPESSIIPCIKTISSFNRSSSRADQRFTLYSFGDTLKKATPVDFSFTETSSDFPSITSDNVIDKASSLIIISDANWTNSVSLSSIAENKSIYYLKLPKPHPAPTINLEINSPEHSLKNNSHIRCNISGFISDTSKLTVRCISAGNILAEKTIKPLTGPIHDEISFDLPEMKPGLHVLRFQALVNDSLVTEFRHMQQVARDIFYYRTHFQEPSVDNRFLLLAFSRDSSFTYSIDVMPDVLIINGYSADRSEKPSPISENGLFLFAGSLPCTVRKQAMTNTLITDLSNYSSFNRIETSSLPSIPVIYNCLPTPLTRIYAWVSCKSGAQPDTVPALYTSVFANKKTLFLGLTNFWKWDFSPLVSDLGEEHAFSFSRRIVETVKEILLSNVSSKYIFFINNDVHSSNALIIDHYIPQNFDFNEKVAIHCTAKNSSGIKLDSTIVTSVNGSGIFRTSFPPLPEGNYMFSTSIEGKNGTFTCTDSAFIRSDNREFLVKGQNEYIFTDIAQPIIPADSTFFSNILNNISTATMVPVKTTFTINRNWTLLLLILIIYGTELFLRRRWELD